MDVRNEHQRVPTPYINSQSPHHQETFGREELCQPTSTIQGAQGSSMSRNAPPIQGSSRHGWKRRYNAGSL